MNVRASTSLALLLTVFVAVGAEAQIHGSELPPLKPDSTFPRCDSRELAVAGFPDHMHAYTWSGWQVLTDSEGRTYGPGSLCKLRKVLPREGLIVEPGQPQ